MRQNGLLNETTGATGTSVLIVGIGRLKTNGGRYITAVSVRTADAGW